ncbi:hypothetical protein GGX14DRAFT_556986 [Mycena pura]|uniref:Uncharacterized protein n=1 Tax=Mycena pura TaxID=153505 RepID=A0AAD7E2E4_9AGAR|nr:hypothetical protein GGX14DRAFT_556986 [Mycena pura]
MSTISESSLSLVASTLPQSSSTQTMLLGFLTLAFAGSIMYYASPMRLTNVLVATMANAEKTYLEALEIGALDFHTVEMMARAKYPAFAKPPFGIRFPAAPHSDNF